jgi:hypothetical protein
MYHYSLAYPEYRQGTASLNTALNLEYACNRSYLPLEGPLNPF